MGDKISDKNTRDIASNIVSYNDDIEDENDNSNDVEEVGVSDDSDGL